MNLFRSIDFEHVLRFHAITTVALWIGIAHVISAICIFIDPHSILVTGLAGFRWVTQLYATADWIGGVILFTAGILAILGAILPISPPNRLRLITPQVILLIFTISSVVVSVIEGHYPDGYKPTGGWMFILADQAVAASLASLHVLSILFLPLRSGSHPL